MKTRHILRAQDFDRPSLERLFKMARQIDEMLKTRAGRAFLRTKLGGMLMYAFFYEVSTRTRVSFCTAAEFLGMTAIWTEDAKKFSSVAKGETLEHTIRVLCGYRPDVI